jgi:glycerate 2-kinase
MALAAATWGGAAIRAGLVVGAELGRSWTEQIPRPFETVVSGHPLPTAASEDAGRRALALADSVRPAETLLVLVSGGASALLAVPADGVTLDDKRLTTNQLLRAGADIYALNTVRKHLSAIKGGWLAARTKGLCRTLVISDVVGDDLSVIASGPTVADASTFDDALDVLNRFGGPAAFPAAVVERLRRGAAGAIDDTPSPGDPRLARTTTTVIGSRRDAMAGAAEEAARHGYRVVRIDDAVTGEARSVAVPYLQRALALADSGPRPVCILSSGETTVHVTGSGKGGRNQELALAATPLLATVDAPVALASAGTDGVDGPTDAAGAIVDRTTLSRASAAGLPPDRFLSDNNAYAFFDALGDLIHTGPTGTNVGDLQVILLA